MCEQTKMNFFPQSAGTFGVKCTTLIIALGPNSATNSQIAITFVLS